MFSKMLFESIPTFLTRMLGVVLQKGLHLKISVGCLRDKKASTIRVFDLVNCGPNTRFHTLTGYVAHNCLGLGYGMGPQKMVTSMYEKGYSLDFKTAKQFKKVYWELFSGVRRFADKLSLEMESQGQIVNPFGYRLTCAPNKAYNYFCQSSVSGIMHVFGAKLFSAAPWARFVVLIHDEFIVAVPEDRVEEFKKIKDLATDSLNADLGWEVKIRTGFVPGDSLYTAK